MGPESEEKNQQNGENAMRNKELKLRSKLVYCAKKTEHSPNRQETEISPHLLESGYFMDPLRCSSAGYKTECLGTIIFHFRSVRISCEIPCTNRPNKT